MAPENCAFHADRPTGLHCTRCGRPACPECLTPASVGFQCRACLAQDRPVLPRTAAGGRTSTRPTVTLALMAVNIAVYLLTALQGRTFDIPTASPVFQQGVLVPDLVAGGQWWRVITAGFLHAGILHIATNMFSLYVIGVGLERILGGARFLVVYLLSLLGGSALVLLTTTGLSTEVGASGAIFGLLGAIFVVYRKLRLNLQPILVTIVINAVITFSVPGISWQAHVGGLVTGLVAGAVMLLPAPAVRRRVQRLGSIGILVVVLAVILVWATLHHTDYCGLSGNQFVPCAD